MNVQPILQRLIEARLTGSLQTHTNVVDIERRQNAQYIADISMRLSSEVIAILSQATQLRESGLTAARLGDLKRAHVEINDAQQCIESVSDLSYEAWLCAFTFQAAAVAYLHYVEGHLREAKEELDRALETCELLSSKFGYSNEVRRIHLCRNVVRVMYDSNHLSEAWPLCCGLLRYIWEPDASWPYNITGSAQEGASRQVLRHQERLFVSDQVLAELVQIVVASDARTFWRSDNLSPIASAAQESPMVSQVVSLCESLIRRGLDTDFLFQLCKVIEGGRGELPQTWAKLDRFAMQLMDNYRKVAERFPIPDLKNTSPFG